jgi:very-short-patch-repair endonuclease
MTLWRALRRKQLSEFGFRRQVPLCGFIVDFACTEARLVIEVDGATHSTDEEIERDRFRDAKLSSNGNSILRFTNDEVYRNLDGVVETYG